MANKVVVGIDLGTRFSCVSVWTDKGYQMITDRSNNSLIPSVVRFMNNCSLVGPEALMIEPLDSQTTIYDVKRIIGRKITDPIVNQTKDLLSYGLVSDHSDYQNILIQLTTNDPTLIKKIYKPEEICAQILIYLKQMVIAHCGSSAIEAVLTVPAYFNDSQRQATLDSAQIAGLKVIKIMNEPTAAALAYGLGSKNWLNKNYGNVIVYDLGAGTLDVSLIHIENGVFETLAVGGNSRLGGEDIDYLLIHHCISRFQNRNNVIVSLNAATTFKLKSAVETAKKILSVHQTAIICVDDFYEGKKLYVQLSRKIFNRICRLFYAACLKPLVQVIESARLSKNDIDDVVLVGGSTRIPKIKQLIGQYFEKTRLQSINQNLHPDEVVAIGAAIYGYTINQTDRSISDLLLLDVTPLSLGIETIDHQMAVIIPRNTIIPTEQMQSFITEDDCSSEVFIKIFEGERMVTTANTHLGTFKLTNLPQSVRSVITITFKIDTNGILQVSAFEKHSAIKNEICLNTMSTKGRLTAEQIELLMIEANIHRQNDEQLRAKINYLHDLQKMCHTLFVYLEENDCQLPSLEQISYKQCLTDTLQWMKESNLLSLAELKEKHQFICQLYEHLLVHTIDCSALPTNEASSSLSTLQNDTINIKNTLLDLCKQITLVANNPITQLTLADKEAIIDYLATVTLWLYTSKASTDQCLLKIEEVNNRVNTIMEKYTNESFLDLSAMSKLDELKFTCLTILHSIKVSFLSLTTEQADHLQEVVETTYHWLIDHLNETDDLYVNKLTIINDLCNDYVTSNAVNTIIG